MLRARQDSEPFTDSNHRSGDFFSTRCFIEVVTEKIQAIPSVIIIWENGSPRLPVPLSGGLGKWASSLFLRFPSMLPRQTTESHMMMTARIHTSLHTITSAESDDDTPMHRAYEVEDQQTIERL
jgi:hypothetical protein